VAPEEPRPLPTVSTSHWGSTRRRTPTAYRRTAPGCGTSPPFSLGSIAPGVARKRTPVHAGTWAAVRDVGLREAHPSLRCARRPSACSRATRSWRRSLCGSLSCPARGADPASGPSQDLLGPAPAPRDVDAAPALRKGAGDRAARVAGVGGDSEEAEVPVAGSCDSVGPRPTCCAARTGSPLVRR
jgi:hypothetical protein